MSKYYGATESELLGAGAFRRTFSSVHPAGLFPHQGEIQLTDGELVLTGWRRLPLKAIRRVRLEFTEAYGRLHAGGIGPEGPNLSFFVRGEPLVLDLENGERIYLIVDRSPITGRTRNREWYDTLRASIGTAGVH